MGAEERVKRRPVPLVRRRVVRPVVRHREPVRRGIDLHRVLHARRGVRGLQARVLLGREGRVVLCGGDVHRGLHPVGEAMRAVRVGGVGQPAPVERRGRPDPVREPAGDEQRGPTAHAVAEHADPRAGHLGAAREEREERPGVPGGHLRRHAARHRHQPLPLRRVGEHRLGVERPPLAEPVVDVRQQHGVAGGGEPVRDGPEGLARPRGVREEDGGGHGQAVGRDVQGGVAGSVGSGEVDLDPGHDVFLPASPDSAPFTRGL